MADDGIALRNRNLTCVIRPDFGGALTMLEMMHKGQAAPVLHPLNTSITAAFDPCGMALSHIAPFGGAIRGNAFKWEGRPHALAPNLPNEALFRNGVAWQKAWTGKKDGHHSASLLCRHIKEANWPFDFSLRAVFDLEEDNLNIAYELTFEGRQGTMPMGLGTEMRFPKHPKTMLSAGVSQMWHADGQGIPLEPGEVTFSLDLKAGVEVEKLNVRRWFSGWTGKAIVDHPVNKMSVTVKTGDFRFIGLSSQPENPYFRVTALSHVAGALDIRGHDEDVTGLKRLGPGESYAASLKIDVDMGNY